MEKGSLLQGALVEKGSLVQYRHWWKQVNCYNRSLVEKGSLVKWALVENTSTLQRALVEIVVKIR